MSKRMWMVVVGWMMAMGPMSWAAQGGDGGPEPNEVGYEPTDAYAEHELEGWRVLVNKRYQAAAGGQCAEVLKLLGCQLYGVSRRVPSQALGKLRTVTIWVEQAEGHHACMAYHPDAHWVREHAMNPEKARCVEIASGGNFLAWTRQQPAMVLHELAHAYHHQFMAGGFGNAEVAAAYEEAKEARLYESVLHWGGKASRAYAMTNPQEYFAETTEAFFWTNDMYPFVAAELRERDAGMYSLLDRLWNVGVEG